MQERCSICNTELQGPYCHSCGQEIGKRDVTFFSMLSDFVSSIFDMEKSALAAIVLLFWDPYKIVSNYWKGNKKYYPGPGKMLLLAIALAALFLTFKENQILGLTLTSSGVSAQVLLWMILIPFLSFTSYLAMIRRKISFTKHLVSTIYVSSGLFSVLVGLFALLSEIYPLGQAEMAIFLCCYFIWNSRVIMNGRGTLYVIFGTVLQILIFIAFVVIIGILISYFLPDAIISGD